MRLACLPHTIPSHKYNHRMDPGQLSFGIFDLSGVIMLVLAATSFVYLLRVKNKSDSSWMLLWFVLCVILSSIATIITNIGTIWDWAFAPSQDAMLILGGVFLVRFAYLYPTNDQAREARWVVTFFVIMALAALAYAVSFGIRYIANIPGDLDENQAFYLLTPIAIILTVIVFFRRSTHWSAQTHHPSETQKKSIKSSFKSFFKPNNLSAVVLRNYGLALAISLVPAVTLIEKTGLPPVVASFIFNFGAVMAITALMLAYLSYAPEPVSISAKLVGISMVSIMQILGLAGVWVYHTNPGLDEHSLVLTFIALVLLSSLLIIFIFPVFFRTALLDPLKILLRGVKTANDGDLSVQLAVQYDDEICFLTQSFNRMASTLKEASSELRNRAIVLEAEVNRRTVDLSQTNVRLEKENKERKIAEARLNQQLIYQKALASCSQSLLVAADNERNQLDVLNQALEHLRSAAQASRAYIHHIFDDPELGPCVGILAEVCAPGIPPHINNPRNLKFPLSNLPTDFVNVLTERNPYGGPVKDVFASTPELQEAFLSQNPPLLSVMLFPLFDKVRLGGFIGFDDCITEREWDTQEISILRTTAEMISSTMQRWQAEEHLRETLSHLEERVRGRTIEYAQANAELRHEIFERQRFQDELEGRLEIESMLANISTRLLEPTKIRDNITASLEDLGRIMDAGRIYLVEFDLQATNQVRNYIEWHKPEVPPVSEEFVQSVIESLSGLRGRLRKGETIYIEDTAQYPSRRDVDMHPLQALAIRSLVLLPLTIDQRVHGVLGCINLQTSSGAVQTNIRTMELVSGMLKSLLQREYLIQTLEEQVAERTRQLTTFLDMAMLSEKAQDLADILQPTLLSIIQIAGCDAAGIHVNNEKKSSLELIAQRGIPSEFLQPLSEIKIDAELAVWLKKADTYQVLGDQDGSPVFPDPFCFPGYRTFFANRLSAGNKSLGLLSCYRVEDQPFSPFEATLLTSLSDLLGIIVENYRLRIEAQELAAVEERQRLAREIHDAISQSVYSLSLFARSANDALDAGNKDKLLSNLHDIETTALQAMQEMRLLLYQLREAERDEDIATALDGRFKQVENRLGIQATREIGADIILSNHIQHEVWRIIIEALNNSVKHASASHVHVQIACQDEVLCVSIRDDGIGFDIWEHSPGMGLKNIQARAEKLAGQLDIISESGHGTQITLKVPMACMDAQEGV